MMKIFFFLVVFIFTRANAQTNVSGGLFTNTTWDAAGSPYIVSGNVVVFQDLILTVLPGTEVRFEANASVEMRGYLRVLGTADSMVTFTANSNFPFKGFWKGIMCKITSDPVGQGNQVYANYLTAEYADRLFDLDLTHNGPFIFNHSIFSNNVFVNYDGALGGLEYTNCIFNGNDYCVGGSNITSIVNYCEFNNNIKGVEGYSDVQNSKFNHNHIAIDYGTKVYNNDFFDNDTAIYAWFYAGVQMVNNHIHDNHVGVYIYTFGIDPEIYFRYNKVCNNSYKNIIYNYSGNADLSQNCWCDTDSLMIHNNIIDGYSNVSYGLTHVFPLMNTSECQTVGIEEIRNPTFQFYPNPSSDFIQFASNETEGLLEILNTSGQILRTIKINREGVQWIDINGLAPGMYLISLQTPHGRATQKLMVE